MPTKVIDLFAGPGGLGEGFSAFRNSNGQQAFKIAMSIEKEVSAHRTLLLRAFFRQFPDGAAPEAYYAFLRGELGGTPEEQLYRLPEFQSEVERARIEAQAIELGATNNTKLYKKIREVLEGEDCVLIGGPPCQAYSLVGRARNSGEKSKPYDPDEDHRNFLYREYLRIIAKFQPAVFLMENVKGMLSAKTSEGPVFPRIRSDLSDPRKSTGVRPDKGRQPHKYSIFSFVVSAQNDLLGGVTPEKLDARDFVIKAENFGIPQRRHRVILLGVREDLTNNFPPTLVPQPNQHTVRDAISGLPALRSGISRGQDDALIWSRIPQETLESLNSHLDNQMIVALTQCQRDASQIDSRGAEFGLKTTYTGVPKYLREWYQDPRMKGHITNHSTRAHIASDLSRYWFAAVFRQSAGKSPKAPDFPKPLWPAHANFLSGKFTDRFRVQGWDEPATTVTSHISKDGHYFIHPDPYQIRSLTVREAARIQTFPDNYHFVGKRTQQYVQVGNAVPPLLALQLATLVNTLT